MPLRTPTTSRIALPLILCATLLAACGGGAGSGDDHDHDFEPIDTAGRLAIAEKDAPILRIQDLDLGQVEASHSLDHPASAVYASPGGRYAVIFQRTQDQVQFVDGGIWQEDHGDHLHDYKQASRKLAWKLSGPRPTHYDVQHGRQAAVFMDGVGDATPPRLASVKLLTDASIGAANTVASLDLDLAIHGLAEPVDNRLLAVARAADASDALPTHLRLYHRTGSTYSAVRELPTRCDGMHGSFSSGSYTAVGCNDGVLLVRHVSDIEVSDQKVSTPVRIGTIAGHPRAPGQFVGIGNDGIAPAPMTTRFFAIDGSTAQELELQGWSTGRLRRAHAFDRTGQRFFVLDDEGSLTVLQRQQGGQWAPLVRVPQAIPAMPAAAPWPAFATSGARDEIYLTDPVARQLVVIDSTAGTVTARRSLGYVPAYVTWLGIQR